MYGILAVSNDSIASDIAPGEADLTSCDRELIHIPGSIQPYGVLLAVDRKDFVIRQFAGDTRALLGIKPRRIAQLSLYNIFTEPVLQAVAERLRDPAATVVPSIQAGIVVLGAASRLDMTIHAQGDLAVVELEPSRCAADGYDPISDVKRMLASVATAENFAACCDAAVRAVRAITGFDRVMIYQFLDDGSGKVVAEDTGQDVDRFLGLHYPASDIPRQARELYRRNWLRLIPDIDYRPAPLKMAGEQPGSQTLDMSHCFLRSVSPIHLAYLRNMGVTASMSMSIVHDEALWGLIACHSYTPRYPGVDLRTALELFAQIFSLYLEAKLKADQAQRRVAAQRVHSQLTTDALQAEDMPAALVGGRVTLLDLVPSGGAAAWVNGRLASVGKVPPVPVLEQLIKWLDSTNHAIFHTQQLGSVFEPALAHLDTASGLLAIASQRRERDYILWFRPQLIETVTWGGQPDKPVEVGPLADRLAPRKSFAAWKQEMRGRSVPWDQADLEIAQGFHVTLLEAVFRQMDTARRERDAVIEHQNVLMAELDHRVKNILATISAVVQLTKSNANDLDTYAVSLQNRIRAMALAHELLAETRWHGVPLADLLAEGEVSFATGGRVIMSGEPVTLSPRAALPLALVVHELAANAVKHGALSVPHGRIGITWGRDNADNLLLHWRESGGPSVSPPVRRGFGSLLIERSLKQEIGGSAIQTFEPEGLVCHLVIPRDCVTWTS